MRDRNPFKRAINGIQMELRECYKHYQGIIDDRKDTVSVDGISTGMGDLARALVSLAENTARATKVSAKVLLAMEEALVVADQLVSLNRYLSNLLTEYNRQERESDVDAKVPDVVSLEEMVQIQNPLVRVLLIMRKAQFRVEIPRLEWEDRA